MSANRLKKIQGIFASWTGLASPGSVEERRSTPVAGTGKAGPRWLEEIGCPRVGFNFLGLVYNGYHYQASNHS